MMVAMRAQIKAVLLLSSVLLTPPTFAFAQDCSSMGVQLTRLSGDEGGSIVLSRYRDDKNPFLIQESCVVIDSGFWPRGRRGRFLQLGVVNYIPSDDEPDISYLGIQAARRNPLRDHNDIIRLFRLPQWVRETANGVEPMKGVLGRVAPLKISEWKSLHSGAPSNLGLADARMTYKWHAQPAEGTPSSWELREYWASPSSYEEGTLLTNLLLRFSVNRDQNKISIIPFEIGIPQDADEVIITVHSNIDAIRKTVRFTFK
jgi:hypothetical protein